jgi:cytochrome P450
MPEFESHTLPALPRPDLASPTFKANPYPFYAHLRAQAPVYRFTLHTLGKRDGWLVTRYADVLSVLKDPRLAKDPRSASGTAKEPWVPGFLKPLQRNMLDVHPPDHTRLRGLVHKAFTPRLVEQLRGRIQALCDQFLDEAQREGRIDVVRSYALPLPATIIAELLGVPLDDRHKFHAWSSHIVSASSPRDMLVALPYALVFLRYVRQLVARRRAAPRDDLISALVNVEEAGDRLTTDELLAMVFLLLVAPTFVWAYRPHPSAGAAACSCAGFGSYRSTSENASRTASSSDSACPAACAVVNACGSSARATSTARLRSRRLDGDSSVPRLSNAASAAPNNRAARTR